MCEGLAGESQQEPHLGVEAEMAAYKRQWEQKSAVNSRPRAKSLPFIKVTDIGGCWERCCTARAPLVAGPSACQRPANLCGCRSSATAASMRIVEGGLKGRL